MKMFIGFMYLFIALIAGVPCLLAQEQLLSSPAAMKVRRYIENKEPVVTMREEKKQEVKLFLESIEPACKSLSLDGVPCLVDRLWVSCTLRIDGLPVSFGRFWYQDSKDRKFSVDTREGSLFQGMMSFNALEDLISDSYMDPRTLKEIKVVALPQTEKSVTHLQEQEDLATRLQKQYLNDHPDLAESHQGKTVKDKELSLNKIVYPHYSVNSIYREEAGRIVLFSYKGGKPHELLRNHRGMKLIPLPQKDYFIVLDFPDGHVSSLLLYKVGDTWVRDGKNYISCLFQAPAAYDVAWSLIKWDWEASVMIVRRREGFDDVGYDEMDIAIPIR